MNQEPKTIPQWVAILFTVIAFSVSYLTIRFFLNKPAEKQSLKDEDLKCKYEELLKKVDTFAAAKTNDSLMTVQFMDARLKQEIINQNLKKSNDEKLNRIKSMSPDSLYLFASSVKKRSIR